MDSSATAVVWPLSEPFRHPKVMKKVHQELEAVVGVDRMVEESDLVKLEYLDTVVKETFRLHPVASLLVPYEAMEDCIVDGLHIPRKSRIIINAWNIGRDPNVWPNAEEFHPQRFVGSDIDVKGHDFQLIPFGSGRRGCPGSADSGAIDWELPNGMLPGELDMSEEFGLATPRAKPLLAVPSYRLRM